MQTSSVYKTWDHMHTFPHTSKTLEANYITHILHYENVAQMCSILNISIQKFIWSYSKKLSKENIAFNSIVCFTQTKVLAFSLKQIKQTPEIWLKIQLK